VHLSFFSFRTNIASILDLSRNDDEDDDDAADREEEIDHPEDLNESGFQESGSIKMGFQERSLREYFQAVDVDENGLRTPPRMAQLTIFEMTANCLLAGCKRPNYTSEKNLLDYSACFWIRHFIELDLSVATDQEIINVVEKFHLFFQNTNNVARTLEYYSGQTYSELLPGNDLSWLKNVESWIHRALSITPNDIRPELALWMSNFTIDKAFFTLARGHVENWFKELFGTANSKSLQFARDALTLVSLSF
jgi:hypothetical protein